MKCPHCLAGFHDHWQEFNLEWPQPGYRLNDEVDGYWRVRLTRCPSCGRAVVRLVSRKGDVVMQDVQVWPKGTARVPLPASVPESFAKDCREAGNILADSPRASAAISRYALQRLLREKSGVTGRDLSEEIDKVLESKALPSDLAEDLDSIRVIGNFGTHPIKSKSTGEIVEVEPGEAEHTLTVLEELLDFYFVRPAAREAKRAEINKKLADAGKPPLKSPPK